MRHGSLFSGIGGFDLAAEWMGWENVFHCENNPFGQKVLKYYWPSSLSYEDIKTTDFTIHRGTIDVLTGGFPCQPYSQAGKRLGKEDDRHLWPEMLRAIREIQPSWIVGENVRGFINWNEGLVFDEVQVELENEGYEILPFLLPACAVNAPHRRDRIWIVAYRNCNDAGRCKYGETRCKEGEGKIEQKERKRIRTKPQRISSKGIFTHTHGIGFGTESDGFRKSGFFNENSEGNYWQNFPTQSPICDGNDGFSSQLDGITISRWRQESIKAGGNAVVPQIPFAIFKAIQEYEKAKPNP